MDDGGLNLDKGIQDDLYWDYDSQEWVHINCNPEKMWYNIFSNEYEHIPKLMREPDKERSLQVSMNRTINVVNHLARCNFWEWFITFTFNPEKVDSFDYAACTKSLSDWLRSMRRSVPDMGYLIVPELHKSGRYHFHGLFFGCDNLNFVESGHYTKGGDIIYNVGKYRLGWTTATRVKDNTKVTKYICKYITKDLCAVSSNKKRYWRSRNLNLCEMVEVLLDPDRMAALQVILRDKASHIKSVQNGDLITTYYEMGVIL